jgi:galactose-1-phosphate uridylyltransferase
MQAREKSSIVFVFELKRKKKKKKKKKKVQLSTQVSAAEERLEMIAGKLRKFRRAWDAHKKCFSKR